MTDPSPIAAPIITTAAKFAAQRVGSVEKSKLQREAAKTMWEEALALRHALPIRATIHLDVPKGDQRAHDMAHIAGAPPTALAREQDNAFMAQWSKFYGEVEEHKPYLPRKLYRLLVDYEDFLSCTVTAAKFHRVLDDIPFPWEQPRERSYALSYLERRQHRKKTTGRGCLMMLEDAVCRAVRNV